MSELVTYAAEGPVATITMDDGKVNVVSPAMLEALNAALDQAESDGATVVLTGRESKFCAGFELATLTGGTDAGPALLRGGFELSERLLSFPTPVVIACTGHALAMGAFLLLSADYRIGTEGSFKIGANEVAIGMVMPDTAVAICRQRVPATHFDRVVATAEIFDPSSAIAAGFLDEAVPADQLADRAAEVATRLASLDMSAHRVTKLRIRAATLATMREAMDSDDKSFKEMILAAGSAT